MGGVERAIYEIAKRMATYGYEVKIVTSSDRTRKEKIIDGLKVVECKPIFRVFKSPFMPAIIPKILTEDFDVIHVNATVPFVSDVSVFIAKIRGKKIIYHHHFDGNAEGLFGRFLASIYNRTIARLCCLFADKIVVTTKSYIETSEVLNGIIEKVSKKIEIIPPGITKDIFKPNLDASKIRKRYGIKDNEHIILFVGRLVPYKSIDLLINAMKNIDARLIIVGKGELEKELKKLAKDIGIEDKIIFAGYVPDSELPLYYNIADVFVLPSQKRGEAFGLVSLEALACGVPVITSDIPGVRDVVPDNCGLKFKDQKDLEQKINMLLKNEELRKRMGRNGVKFVLKERTWDKLAEKFKKIYEDLALTK